MTDATQQEPEIKQEHAIRPTEDSPIGYDAGREGYYCPSCRATDQNASIYDTSIDGVLAAASCCQTLAEIDRETLRAVPDIDLELPEGYLDESELTREELAFLSQIYCVQAGKLDPALEFCPVVDSGVDLRNAAGVTYKTEQQLVDRGYLLASETPRKQYCLTEKGLAAIGEDPTAHEELPAMHERCLRRATRVYLEAEYAETPGHSVDTDVECDVAATDSADPSRATLPVAVTDREGNVIAGAAIWPPVRGTPGPDATLSDAESEPADTNGETAYDAQTVLDYQTLVGAQPSEAIWITWNHEQATRLLATLEAAGKEGRVRFSAGSYADTVRVQDFRLDEPGISDIATISHLLDRCEPAWIVDGQEYRLVAGGESDA